MEKKDAYIIIDIGTGNARVALVTAEGKVISIAREDIRYLRDLLYPDALYFEPAVLWDQIVRLTRTVLQQSSGLSVRAVTATSQREGIVLMDGSGQGLIGLPNIDHRGREWEDLIKDKSSIYHLTGRRPSSLFSVLKLAGIRGRRSELWERLSFFLSISDWVEYQLSGVAKYEHSQASETLLYDVEQKSWSQELAAFFGIGASYLPELVDASSVLGKLLPARAAELSLSADVVVVAGGGDTQLAIKSICPSVDDIVLVSGTTTPVVKLVNRYVLDRQERTWTSRDIEADRYVFEANAGVTGLNYQRLKEVFYPNESYEVIEKELAENPHRTCVASLGSLIAGEKEPLVKGGFIFSAPVTQELSRSCFVHATLVDIACSIAENYRVLCEVAGEEKDYVWACGGGMQSLSLRQMIADVLGKEVRVRPGFQHASVLGGALVCNEALRQEASLPAAEEAVRPQRRDDVSALHEQWKKARDKFRH